MSSNQNAIINIQIVNPYQKGFTIICHCLLQWGALYLSYDTSQLSRASKKASIFNKKNYNDQVGGYPLVE